MVELSFRAGILSGQEFLDTGITDLIVVEGPGGPAVFATTGVNGGMTGYRLSAGSTAQLTDTQYFSGQTASMASGRFSMIGESLVIGGNGAVGLLGYSYSTDGSIHGVSQMGGMAARMADVSALHQTGDGFVYLSDENGGGIAIYRPDGSGGFSSVGSALDTGDSFAAKVMAIESVTVGGGTFLLAGCCSEQGVSVFHANAVTGALELRGTMGAAKGLGIMEPVDLEVFSAYGKGFAIVASASGTGGSGALSVMQVTQEGRLVPTDHVLDNRDTRFGAVQSLEVINADGRTYVLAAGGDDGLSLFVLTPGGQLVHLQSVADSLTTGLSNVSAIVAAWVGDRIEVLAASQSEAGLTQFGIGLAGQGQTYQAGPGGGPLTGGALDDIMAGGAGADLVRGLGGDDILIDGAGQDTLDGGDGADIFVLSADGERDRIVGFDAARDRLDLSNFAMFYGASQLDVHTTNWGAELRFRGEVIEVYRLGGGGLSWADIAASLNPGPDRPPLGLSREVPGTAANDVLNGHWGSDFIEGFQGADQIAGQAGDDKLFGGDGNDRVVGELGNDTVSGGAGWDTLFGGAGNDVMDGGDGRDLAFMGDGDDRFDDNAQVGDNAHDRAYGEGGNDTILGGGGNDTFFGGPGQDSLTGGDGDDVLAGGFHDDVLSGGAGNDRVAGEFGNDEIFGGTGHDTLFAGPGDDSVNGGYGKDLVNLGDGNDLFIDNLQTGNGGRDTVLAGSGDDTIEGAGGDDAFFGELGNDLIYAGQGNDLVYGGPGFDTIMAGEGNDTVTAGNGRDLVFLGAGNDRFNDNAQGGALGQDTVFTGAGDDIVQGGAGNDAFYGEDGNDLLLGRVGDDRLFGGNGADTLGGGAGQDTLTGGQGRDVFVFADNDGMQNRVTDFEPGFDMLEIQRAQMTFARLSIHDEAGSVVVNYGSGAIILTGVSAVDLSAGDFLFS